MSSPSQDLKDTIVVTPSLLRSLLDKGVISADARKVILDYLEPISSRLQWLKRFFLFYGVALILASFVYFFAYNWVVLETWQKFALIQGLFLTAIVATLVVGLDDLPGKLSCLASSIMVGILLAVYGQIYQTGADAYSLFMIWSLLIFPWVIISHFAPLWLVWLGVTQLFIGLYWHQQVAGMFFQDNDIFVLLAAFNAIFLFSSEVWQSRFAWLNSTWIRITLVLVCLVYLTNYGIDISLHRFENAQWLLVTMAVILYIGLYLAYRFLLKDIRVLSLWMLSVCITLETLMISYVFHWVSQDSLGFGLACLLMLVLTFILFGIASLALKSIYQQLETQANA